MDKKVSFITTVFNEGENIEEFLASLENQTQFPDEIIIVDAGSTDTTVAKINEFRKKTKLIVHLISKKGNRSSGRNEAIKHAKHEIVACSDVGCVLDKNWLKEITKPFQNKNIDVVSGFYHPIAKNVFQKALAAYTCVMPDRVDPDNFLPSSRSIAFKKECFQKIGGYPEYLDTCEDLVFAQKMKEKGCIFTFQKSAVVFWYQKNTFKDAFLQFYQYAIGDGQAHFFRPQTPLLFARYIIAFLILLFYFYIQDISILCFLIAVFFLYCIWSIIKNYKYVKDWRAFYLLPVFQFLADIAVLTGTTRGYIESKK